jgi:hypothetical protein
MKISQIRQLIKEELLIEGYSNYWQQSEDFTSSEWSKIVRLAKSAIKTAEKHGIVIRDGWGKGKPVVNNKEIFINGDAENDLDHETFYLTKERDMKRKYSEPGSGFTKTARKPYDAVVATILVGIKKIAPKKFSAKADGSLRVGGINKWSNKY